MLLLVSEVTLGPRRDVVDEKPRGIPRKIRPVPASVLNANLGRMARPSSAWAGFFANLQNAQTKNSGGESGIRIRVRT